MAGLSGGNNLRPRVQNEVDVRHDRPQSFSSLSDHSQCNLQRQSIDGLGLFSKDFSWVLGPAVKLEGITAKHHAGNLDSPFSGNLAV